MGFWPLRRKSSETLEQKAARKAARDARDAATYDAIMQAFVHPLPTFSQWAATYPTGHPPTYETLVQPNYAGAATYYPNQTYENPYGYVACSSSASVSSSEILPTYVDSTYYPVSRQVHLPLYSLLEAKLTN